MAKKLTENDLELQGTSEHDVLEEAGVGFNPTTQHVDLTKEEKRRTTALLMAIQAYNNLIIKDAEMYLAVSREQSRESDGLKIQPATMNAMVHAALQFDDFISGELQKRIQEKKENNGESTSGS